MRLAIDPALPLDPEAADRLEDRICVAFGRFEPLIRSIRVAVSRPRGGEPQVSVALQRADGSRMSIEMPGHDIELDALEHLVDRAARTLQRELRQRINP